MNILDFKKTEDARTIRTKYSGDKMYLVQEDKRYWIKNPETLFALGFNFGDESIIDMNEFYELKDGGTIDLKTPKATPSVQTQDDDGVLDYRREA